MSRTELTAEAEEILQTKWDSAFSEWWPEEETTPRKLDTPFNCIFSQLLIQKSKRGNPQKEQELVRYFTSQEEALMQLQKNPSISLFGGINYGMTYSQMKKSIEEKFNNINQAGKIVTQKRFEEIKDFYYTDHADAWSRFESQSKTNPILFDLTRIWGAEYLKSKMKESSNLAYDYDTPEYVIVNEDPKNITVSLWFESRFPVVSTLIHGKIYFKRIIGKPIGGSEKVQNEIGEGTTVNYVDLPTGKVTWENERQHNNIIQEEETGKIYIVDTEFSSFETDLKTEEIQALHYGAKKFSYQNYTGTSEYQKGKKMGSYEYQFELKDSIIDSEEKEEKSLCAIC
jgi:hypothetical protein